MILLITLYFGLGIFLTAIGFASSNIRETLVKFPISNFHLVLITLFGIGLWPLTLVGGLHFTDFSGNGEDDSHDDDGN